MKLFFADLHIHTALSPCAENEMTPPAIIKAAKAEGLDIIGISDLIRRVWWQLSRRKVRLKRNRHRRVKVRL